MINMTKLAHLHADIDMRVQSILEVRPDWLCTKGCDRCCRQLAEMPSLTLAEWNVLRDGLQDLAPERLREISRKMAAVSQVRPITCPMLELAEGTCPVYAQRPVACRTYGFYVQRDQGLYCGDIAARVDDGTWVDVLWGNHDAVDRQLADLGEVRALNDWFEPWIVADKEETIDR
jgi:Fe-S-cluster containining protein